LGEKLEKNPGEKKGGGEGTASTKAVRQLGEWEKGKKKKRRGSLQEKTQNHRRCFLEGQREIPVWKGGGRLVTKDRRKGRRHLKRRGGGGNTEKTWPKKSRIAGKKGAAQVMVEKKEEKGPFNKVNNTGKKTRVLGVGGDARGGNQEGHCLRGGKKTSVASLPKDREKKQKKRKCIRPEKRGPEQRKKKTRGRQEVRCGEGINQKALPALGEGKGGPWIKKTIALEGGGGGNQLHLNSETRLFFLFGKKGKKMQKCIKKTPNKKRGISKKRRGKKKNLQKEKHPKKARQKEKNHRHRQGGEGEKLRGEGYLAWGGVQFHVGGGGGKRANAVVGGRGEGVGGKMRRVLKGTSFRGRKGTYPGLRGKRPTMIWESSSPRKKRTYTEEEKLWGGGSFIQR